MVVTDYRGMSYSSASKEGARLLAEALEFGKWFALPEKLKQLRDIMTGHMERGTATRRADLCGND